MFLEGLTVFTCGEKRNIASSSNHDIVSRVAAIDSISTSHLVTHASRLENQSFRLPSHRLQHYAICTVILAKLQLPPIIQKLVLT